MTSFPNLDAFTAHAGQELGTTDWVTISQEQIQLFADATGDHQWIHLEPDRAARESPFKTTIAHGFLTLSLAPRLLSEIYTIESVKMGVNYGANKIRFTNAVPSGSRLRMKAWLHHVEPTNANEGARGVRVIIECVFEVEGQTKPACVAELISLLFE
ncbi:MaoC family dehydratase [Fibrella aquatilis]|uniref:MaoC family dehydratase n=1 Tax=Fibrella aquatilis TaxID=2817059 RepID=A0A939G357_9BACT|nr:MaoC family dehydratase [Fibrella aquatilis]MBO0931036.1 MaoC family dehydratase [Fibrella aquatilis]